MFRTTLLMFLILPAVLVLGGCAHEVRGELHYDLRPEGQRSDIVWPKAPDKARFRYAGELVGEQNFQRNVKTDAALGNAMKWLVGLVEDSTPLMLQRPQHGMVGDNDRVYVVDASRNAVLVFDPQPPEDSPSDKDGGQLLVWDELGNGMRLGTPVSLAQVWNGDIAVSDSKYGVVFRLNPQGKFVAAIGESQLERPTGIAFDSKRGLLYVADTAASSIKVFDATGARVNAITKAGDAELNAPTLISIAGDRLYVTDTLNSRIEVFDLDGRHVRSFGERGIYVGNLTRPKGVAVGAGGIVYVVESFYGHLLAYNQDGHFLMGINGTGLKDDRFNLPSGVWTDNKGRVFLADMFNGRVVVFDFLGDKNE